MLIGSSQKVLGNGLRSLVLASGDCFIRRYGNLHVGHPDLRESRVGHEHVCLGKKIYLQHANYTT